jgi:hypothetical protein
MNPYEIIEFTLDFMFDSVRGIKFNDFVDHIEKKLRFFGNTVNFEPHQ